MTVAAAWIGGVLGTVLGVLFILLLIWWIRAARALRREDQVEISTIPYAFTFPADTEASLISLIVDTINAMGGNGHDAEQHYQRLLGEVRQNSASAVPAIVPCYRQLAEDRYLDRWSVIQLLSDLEQATSIELLEEVVTTPIPEERSKDPYRFSTRREELIIRTTAVDAVSRVARTGNQDAIALLLRLVRNENLSVQRAVVQAYLEVGGDDARERLTEELAAEDLHLLEIGRRGIDDSGLRLDARPRRAAPQNSPSAVDAPAVPPPPYRDNQLI